jgi:CHAT domain-containing protein
VTGWPQAFLSMGASAVIAPLWSVHDQPAHDIAKQFYNFIISNSPISLGAALQDIRNQFKTTNDMTYLAYLLYGDPTAMVSVE